MKSYQSHNIVIKTPYNERKHRIIFYTTTTILLCALIACAQPVLFATNSQIDLLSPLEAIQTKYVALAERYQFLTHEYDSIQDKYAQLLAQHHITQESTARLNTQIKDNQLTQTSLKKRAKMLEDMNKYLCKKITTQQTSFDRLTFDLNHKLEKMQKEYEEEYNRILTVQHKRMEQKYQEALNEQKKPYREFFYSNYK